MYDPSPIVHKGSPERKKTICGGKDLWSRWVGVKIDGLAGELSVNECGLAIKAEHVHHGCMRINGTQSQHACLAHLLTQIHISPLL